MTYKFSNFQAELIDPIIESVQSSYVIGGQAVQVTAVLNANGNKLFGVDLGVMDNTDTWGDDEVMAFAVAQLETFKL